MQKSMLIVISLLVMVFTFSDLVNAAQGRPFIEMQNEINGIQVQLDNLKDQHCPDGQFVTGINEYGVIICSGGTGGNQPPIAVAETETACTVSGVPVFLSASSSSDPEGDELLFEWSFYSIPPGSTATFNNSTVVNPTFTPDIDGIYEVRVSVSDGINTSISGILGIEVDSEAADILLVSGNGQVAYPGIYFDEPLVVKVVNTCGSPVPGLTIQWSGDVEVVLDNNQTITDVDGSAQNLIQAVSPGTPTVTAGIPSIGRSITFNLTILCIDNADCSATTGGICDSSGVCQAPSCIDGIQNQDETGVDCGGEICEACLSSS